MVDRILRDCLNRVHPHVWIQDRACLSYRHIVGKKEDRSCSWHGVVTYGRARFALMGSVVALIGVLMVLLSGLSVGLLNDGVSGLKENTPGISVVRVRGGRRRDRRVLPVGRRRRRGRRVGTKSPAWTPRPRSATRSSTRAATPAWTSTSRYFGVLDRDAAQPTPAAGDALAGEGQVVLTGTLQDEGVAVGDVLTVDRTGTGLEVVGFVDGQHTFGHVDVGYVDLRTWRKSARASARRAGARPRVPGGHRDRPARSTPTARRPATTPSRGTLPTTLTDSFDASPATPPR